MLNEKQQYTYNKAKEGYNLFITGLGGSGKSHAIKEIIFWAKVNKRFIGITSSTGVSATHIGGTTIHSFLGLGLGTNNVYKIYNKIKSYYPKYKKLLRLEILIIDEISMINKYLFNKISRLLQLIKRNDKPFGGIQVIISGDFCQLKPVKSNAFCFESINWKLLNMETIHLTKSMRQQNDKLLRHILHNLRFGNCTPEIYNILDKHFKLTRDLQFNEDEVKPTILYSNNIDVDYINISEHNKLKKKNGLSNKYVSDYTKHYFINKYMKDNNINTNIELTINDQVMITKNIDIENKLTNGTRGIITNIEENGVTIKIKDGTEHYISYFHENFEDYKHDINQEVHLSYLPIKLAYALTIHKCQGFTLDYIAIDLGSSIFEYGQGYVGLSRARDLDSIIILDLNKKSFKCHEKVLKFYGIITKKMKKKASKKIYNWIVKKYKAYSSSSISNSRSHSIEVRSDGCQVANQ